MTKKYFYCCECKKEISENDCLIISDENDNEFEVCKDCYLGG